MYFTRLLHFYPIENHDSCGDDDDDDGDGADLTIIADVKSILTSTMKYF